jgi:hypothetical protein
MKKLLELLAIGRPTKEQTAELIEQIHHEFNSAGDRLLAEATSLLADNSAAFKAEKAQRLSRLGFGNTQEAKENQRLNAERRQAQELQALIMDYALRYPTNRFITREQVDTIAAKYNLVVGDVSAYTGFVPDVKLREVEAFTECFRKADAPEKVVQVTKWNYVSVQREEIQAVERMYPGNIIPLSACSLGGSPCVMLNTRHVFIKEYNLVGSGDMLIAAPAKDMNTLSLRKVKGHFMSFTTFITPEIPDPVVLQPVKGGYLIVTAWGDEASDPLVVNPQHN